METNSIAVLTCVYRRPERFERTLQLLAAQSDRAFDTHIIVNGAGLGDTVRTGLRRYPLPGNVAFMGQNRGAFARNELMHELRNDYGWFVWLDDDVEFCEDMIVNFRWNARPDTIWGMDGFRFEGKSYWEKQRVEQGEVCDFVYVACCCIPAGVAQAPGFAEPVDDKYRRLDGIHLCYHAAMQGYTLRKYNPGAWMIGDGKDTYLEEHNNKIELLEALRQRGWRV